MTNDMGSYILLVELKEESNIESKSKKWNLEKGLYLYVGSAMNSLSGRLKHHLSKKDKPHWHIDYLLNTDQSDILFAFLIPGKVKIEENLSKFVSKYGKSVKGFGASDCKIESNLYSVKRTDLTSLFDYLINLEVNYDCFFK